jgi:hypothetical protein
MDKVLQPFDIVSSPYVSLDGSVKAFRNGDTQKGLFMVIAVDYDNVTCAKITSQNNGIYLNQSVPLLKSANFFLKADSFVQLNKLHTLAVSSCTYLGYIDKASRYDIYKIANGYFTSLSRNLRRFCPSRNRYVSPNKIMKGGK